MSNLVIRTPPGSIFRDNIPVREGGGIQDGTWEWRYEIDVITGREPRNF